MLINICVQKGNNVTWWPIPTSQTSFFAFTRVCGDRFRTRKPVFFGRSHSSRWKDRSFAFSGTSTSKPTPHFLARQERWIDLRSRRNSFHTAFQALQDLTQLVELTKNWRVHAKKTQEFYLEHWTVSIRFVGAELVAQSAYQTASKRYETTCSKIGTTITC